MIMKSFKRFVSVFTAALIIFLTASPAFASFNGVLPVASLGTTPTAATVTLSSYSLSAGQTATVTITFPAAPSDFTTSDITASNGTISNLTVTADPKVYTATFTPTAQISASTNTISIAQKVNVTNYTGAGSTPENIAFDGTNMWTANTGGSVTKISPTGTMTTYTGVGLQPSGIAFDGTNMWTNNDDGSVSKITSTGTITHYTGFGTNLFGIAFDGTNMWATDYGANSIVKITSGGAGTVYSGTGGSPWGIAFDGTNMWTANNAGGNVTKVTSTGTMTNYGGTSFPIGIAFDGTNMWTANSGDGTISKITPSGTVTSFSTSGGNPRTLAFDGTNMWATDFSSSPGKIYKITPSGSITTYTSSLFSFAWGIAFDGTNMWVVNRGDSSVSKVVPMGAGVSSNYAINTLTPPAVTASVASSVDRTTATLTGNITGTGGATPTVRGFYYGTTSSFGSTTTESGSFSTGGFTADVTNLSCGTTYYYAAYATNSIGTTTSSPTQAFTTLACRVGGGHGIPVIVMPTSSMGSLDFTIPKETATPAVPITFNADPSTTTGYAISLDPTFANTGIISYTGTPSTFALPTAPGIYTVYVEYFSKTGNHSIPLSHTVSYGLKNKSSVSIPVSNKIFVRTLSLGSHGSDVIALQKLLVKDGELTLPAGMSYGNFGALTKAALEAFQVKYSIAQKGDKGFGSFGPKTQSKANELSAE